MSFKTCQLVLIRKALLFYKNVLLIFSYIPFIRGNTNWEEILSEIKLILDKLQIELAEADDENITKCDNCHGHINQYEDIFIDRYSFNVKRSLVVCCNCYENTYKFLYKNCK